MPEAAALLGLPVDFQWRDATYKVAPRDLALEGVFSRWVSGEALQAITAHADLMSPEVFQAQLDGWRQDVAARLYDYTGYVCQQALRSPSGRKHLAYLQLAKLNKTFRRDMVDAIYQDPAKWQELLLLMRQASGELDPNPQAPPGGGAGGPA